MNIVREAVLAFNGDVQVEAFSSLKKQGVDKLRQKLDSWFSELAPVEETQAPNKQVGLISAAPSGDKCRMPTERVLSGS
ncbi:ATP/GTP-binding protein [Salmonella enterica subsp. arizonae]|uniref:ATP/GTP-binding protein n=1 Tax=Salmonella enterica subsp. arizonae TaxID=59203 RepID=A0A379TMP7_SALER|nr:ATP/GTP-binding protein [Salmonella enterica subsp. arizonae]